MLFRRKDKDLLNQRQKVIAVDFDGVIHSYSSGWRGPLILTDPPVDGAIKWLADMAVSPWFKVIIYSTRARYLGAAKIMREYLVTHGMERRIANRIVITSKKPPAHLFIDDRCYQFNGYFPDTEEILEFRPWNFRAKSLDWSAGSVQIH